MLSRAEKASCSAPHAALLRLCQGNSNFASKVHAWQFTPLHVDGSIWLSAVMKARCRYAVRLETPPLLHRPHGLQPLTSALPYF